MSYTKYTRVGAYAVVKTNPIVITLKTTTCPTHGRVSMNLYGSVYLAFCPMCGKAMDEVTYTTKRTATLYDLLPEDFEDVLAQASDVNGTEEGTLIIYGNGPITLTDPLDLLEGVGIVPIDSDSITQCITSFETHYKDALDELRNRAESVTVHFGVIVYMS